MDLATMSAKADECVDKLLIDMDKKTLRALMISAYVSGVCDGSADALSELQTKLTLGHAARKG